MRFTTLKVAISFLAKAIGVDGVAVELSMSIDRHR